MELTFRKGNLEDAECLIKFLKEIKEDMPQQDWFYLDPPDIVWNQLKEGSLELWLAMDGQRLVAVFDIVYPGLAPYNYGYELNLSQNELAQVIHMDTAAVHRDYRGLGLQKKLLDLAESELSVQGRRILLCTVHPNNVYSLNNMLKHGYRIQKEVAKYGSHRYILRKDIF